MGSGEFDMFTVSWFSLSCSCSRTHTIWSSTNNISNTYQFWMDRRSECSFIRSDGSSLEIGHFWPDVYNFILACVRVCVHDCALRRRKNRLLHLCPLLYFQMAHYLTIPIEFFSFFVSFVFFLSSLLFKQIADSSTIRTKRLMYTL